MGEEEEEEGRKREEGRRRDQRRSGKGIEGEEEEGEVWGRRR